MTNAWNAVGKKIKSGRYLLFPSKNKVGWTESEAHLEPSQTSVIELFGIKTITAKRHYLLSEKRSIIDV